jgi:putative membrane protein
LTGVLSEFARAGRLLERLSRRRPHHAADAAGLPRWARAGAGVEPEPFCGGFRLRGLTVPSRSADTRGGPVRRQHVFLIKNVLVTGEPEGDSGTEPDARFTFANERTFLAWSRTALALVVAGLGIVQLLPPFPGVPWGRHVLGVPLIAFGAMVAVAAYREWVRNQRALRHGQPLPVSVLPKLLAIVVAVMAVISAVVLLVSAVR